MKTCARFQRIKTEAERDIAFHSGHAAAHAGQNSAKLSATWAATARHGMGVALSKHFARCPECG